MTALRARHRALTRRAPIAKQREYQAAPDLRESPERLLASAGSVRRERFAPFFMNLWDARRTLGLESLLFR